MAHAYPGVRDASTVRHPDLFPHPQPPADLVTPGTAAARTVVLDSRHGGTAGGAAPATPWGGPESG